PPRPCPTVPYPYTTLFRSIVRKCVPGKTNQVRAIFEKQPFGELECLVTQKLLDVVKKVVKEELNSENWLHLVARLAGRSYEQMRSEEHTSELQSHRHLVCR